MIAKNKIYILNPAYFLRNDVHRAVIGTFDFPDMPNGMYEKNALHIIHPITATMLSFFDGTRTLGQCVQEISNYFGIKSEETEAFISRYINNNEPLCIKYGEDYIVLPIYTIIESGVYVRPELYRVGDFNIDGEVDLKSQRLYKPVKAIIEMNFKCYTDCKYCYADRNNIKSKQIISPDRLISLIREIKNLGIPSIEVNGGEVLLHSQIDQILKVMSECGYHPFISTKIPLNDNKLSLLKLLGFRHIQISLDSINETTLIEHLNVKEGYFAKISHTMELLDEMGFAWQVNTVITKWNSSIEEEVKPLLVYLSKFKNLRSIKFTPMGFPMYKENVVFEQMRASVEDIAKIEQFVNEFNENNGNIDLIFQKPNCKSDYFPKPQLENFNSRSICSANQKGFVVLPNGEVTICEELYWNPHFIIGDIKEQSIMEIWNSERAVNLFYLNQKDIELDSICAICNNFVQCRHFKGVCWKMVIMAYGNDKWSYPDPACPKSPKPNIAFYY